MTLIAVAGFRRTGKDPEPYIGVQKRYLDGVLRAGGQPVVLGYGQNQALARCDALVLVGGGDVAPGLYGQEQHPETGYIDEERDESEIALVRDAIARVLPVLAICRGAQVLNVALGGTLEQHVAGHRESPGVGIPHDIEAAAGSRVAKICGERFSAWSSHHQVMGTLGAGLEVVARSAHDGVIEGAELPDGWVLAVQWHPERTADEDPVQQALFDALVLSARGATARFAP